MIPKTFSFVWGCSGFISARKSLILPNLKLSKPLMQTPKTPNSEFCWEISIWGSEKRTTPKLRISKLLRLRRTISKPT